MPRTFRPCAALGPAKRSAVRATGETMLRSLPRAPLVHRTRMMRLAWLVTAILAGLAAAPPWIDAQPGATGRTSGAGPARSSGAPGSAASGATATSSTVPSAALPSRIASCAAVPCGTYGIDGAADLEARGLYHFLYLHPSGRFLMAGEWAHNESSRAAGQWTVHGGAVTLTGSAHVETNQGRWDVPYRRVFRQTGTAGRTRLEPEPEKNRFGMLGWPNAYEFKSPRADPPMPGGKIPRDEAGLLALIAALASAPTGATR